MSRILLTWELGLNCGHLTRLLPLAQQLKAAGHSVLVAARDTRAAATVLGQSGIEFVQAPYLPHGLPLGYRAAGYADILLAQGWSDRVALSGLVQAWLTLFRIFRPTQLVLDYSPTVSLAARVAQLPCLLIGNGFELPPLTVPLPPFPGFSWATAEKAAESESRAVASANNVLCALRARPIGALRELFSEHRRKLATFPQLDHYGAREDEDYIGPLLGRLPTASVRWPSGAGPKVFASVRPNTNQANAILSELSTTSARVVCVANGFAPQQLDRYRQDHIHFSHGAVDLGLLLDADLCITYGAEGTMMHFLMAGVPQLILPWHVETYMAARRLQAHGVAAIAESPDPSWLPSGTIHRLATDGRMRECTHHFARQLQRQNHLLHKRMNSRSRQDPVASLCT